MSYTKRAVRGIGIVFFMNALAFIVAYGTRLVLARRLGPAEYGLFYAVFTFVAFFLFFRDLGLNQALTKYLAEFRVQKKLNAIKTSIFSVVFFQGLSSIIFGLTFFVLAPFLAVHYFKTPASEIILQVMVLYTLFSISFTILKNFFSGFQRFKFLAFVDFTKNSIILLLVLLFFSLGFEIFSPVFAQGFVWWED
jgi:O-antigen/teichoic acid export membrane protein